jgi:diguanylate cyclase
MVDIDHFKQFNDAHGHQMGDQVLRLIGSTLTLSVKGQDTPARYGGEEFAIILPRTRLDDAVTLAEQIRKTVATKRVTKKNTGEALGKITLSLGVAMLRAQEPLGDLIMRADEALYAAKRGGRNRVVSEEIYKNVLAAS